MVLRQRDTTASHVDERQRKKFYCCVDDGMTNFSNVQCVSNKETDHGLSRRATNLESTPSAHATSIQDVLSNTGGKNDPKQGTIECTDAHRNTKDSSTQNLVPEHHISRRKWSRINAHT